MLCLLGGPDQPHREYDLELDDRSKLLVLFSLHMVIVRKRMHHVEVHRVLPRQLVHGLRRDVWEPGFDGSGEELSEQLWGDWRFVLVHKWDDSGNFLIFRLVIRFFLRLHGGSDGEQVLRCRRGGPPPHRLGLKDLSHRVSGSAWRAGPPRGRAGGNGNEQRASESARLLDRVLAARLRLTGIELQKVSERCKST